MSILLTASRVLIEERIKRGYPYVLLVSTGLREPSVTLPFHFGIIPLNREAKQWCFETLENRKTFSTFYSDYVLDEVPIREAA